MGQQPTRPLVWAVHGSPRDPVQPPAHRYALPMATKVKRVHRARISSKNQITLPAAALREVGLAPGDEVEISIDDHDEIVVSRHESRFAPYVGALPGLGLDVSADRAAWDDRETGLWQR